MKIGIDTQTVFSKKTGFGFYVENLVNNLKKIDKKNKYICIKPKTKTNEELNTPRRFIWDQFTFPKIAKKKRVDLLHQPCFSAPIFYKGKKIITIHDLYTIKNASDVPFFSRQFFGRWMPFSYKYVDHIIAISEYTKKDIIKYLKIPNNKITVIYEAGDEKCKKITNFDQINLIKNKFSINGDYMIHIGTLTPRKNLEFLIKVYTQVIKKNPNIKLVITGKKGWYYQNLFDITNKLGLNKKVIFTGYITNFEKSVLYSGAKIFLFPSLYEGFGLPLLEAMNCEVPIISSNVTSIPEVVGEAGILLDPHNEKEWIKSINKVLSDQNLRNKMIEKSLLRSKQFSWEKTAKETLKVYEKIYKQ